MMVRHKGLPFSGDGNLRPPHKHLSMFCSFPVVFLLVVVVVVGASPGHAACLRADGDALLLFLSHIKSPPLDWSNSTDCCSWEGVHCDDGGGGSDGRVTRLQLPGRGLTGVLSPVILNLTALTHLNLSSNTFSGSLPSEFFSSLAHLQLLDLSFNGLSGNLPLDIRANSIPVQIIDLSSNRLHGVITTSNSFLKAAWNLTSFNVSNNTFTGPIPSDICANKSSLVLFDLSYNEFGGDIPSGIGNCSRLEVLNAGFNNLSGQVPDEIYRLVSLQQLSLPANHLTGLINGVVQLTNLTVLKLFSNNFSGLIPEDIGSLSGLESLQLHINNFTGPLPPSLMNCTNLMTLNLRVNQLDGDISTFNFSTFQQLRTLDLGNNNFSGNLPPALYACKSLTAVRFASNNLTGQIPPDVVSLQSLSFLSVSNNKLINASGAIRNLMGCKSLTTVILTGNFVNETIPVYEGITEADVFQNIQVLGLGGCRFTGNIPNWLSLLKNLEVLDLSQNRITGKVPDWIAGLSKLFYIDLSDNLISGEFPEQLTRLWALTTEASKDEVERSYLELPVFVMPNNATNQQYNQLSNLPPAIYLSNNSLNGNIPATIGQLKFIHVLDLSYNNFSGRIPNEISNLTNLEKLDLSGNHLSGPIPGSLKVLHFLSSFTVAYNNLQGPIPSGGQFDTFTSFSFDGNPGLCGTIVQRACPGTTTNPHPFVPGGKELNTKLIIGLVLGICFGTGLIVTVLSLWILSKRRINPGGDIEKIEMEMISSNSFIGIVPETDKETSLMMLFRNNYSDLKDLTISELLKATGNFNQENIIGCGGFGLVYKAVLGNGTKLAVKKLSGDFGLMEREFKAEVEALSTAQHENLVSLQGYCMHEGSRLLIYSFMENGSLDYWLHEKPDGPSQLDWPTRLKIARGAGNGLAYMHQICEPHIVHRDIKSSNILLNGKFEAHVADFGLARLILPYQTHVTTELVGTLGYIPPEYGQAWVATLRGDIYSFGIVMLELLSGKRPVEMCKPKMSRELVKWVHLMKSDGKQQEIFDPYLRGKGFEEEMLQVLDVACMCVNHSPLKRPTIKEVVDWLKNVGTGKQRSKQESAFSASHKIQITCT